MASSITTTRKPATRRQRPSAIHPRARRDRKDLQAFFDHFTTCLTTGDGQGVAGCFEYPAVMVMADAQRYGANQALLEPGAVAEFFGKAPQMYHEKGVHETFADIRDIDWVADDLALVRARFPYIDADGNDMGDGEASLYLVRRNDNGHAICAAIPLGTDGDRAGSRRRRPRGDVGDHRE